MKTNHYPLDTYLKMPEGWKREITNPNNEGGAVYIIQLADTDLFKIGISTDPHRRLRQLQSKCPVPLTLHWWWYGHDYRSCEKYLHQALSSRRVKGEWFKLEACHLLQLHEILPLSLTGDQVLMISSN